MIEIYVMRHGQAEVHAAADHLRKLTEHGEREVTEMCTRIDALSSLPHIICSPYVRARQTAEIVAEQSSAALHVYEGITPEAIPSAAIDFVYNYCEQQAISRLLIVSHMPFVASFVEMLAGAERGRHAMPTASVAFLSGDVVAKNCCELHWIKSPQS